MKIKNGKLWVVVAGAVVAGLTTGYVVRGARAAGGPVMPPVMTYAGVLTDANGTPLTGTKNVQLQMWNLATDGTAPVCQTPSTAVTLIAGGFQLPLPDACVAAVHAAGDLWTEVLVDGASLGRTKVGAVPYALEADSAAKAVGPLGTTVSGLQAASVPTGAVMAFDLDACPAGWAPFAPAGGRTIVGTNAAGGNGLSARTRGQTLGEEAHTLTVAELPAHSHTGTTAGGNAMTYRVVYTTLGANTANNHAVGWTGGSAFTDYTDANYALSAHTHAFATAAAGGGQAHNQMQPSLALLYCKKS
ncbi:MAG TPA: hypothetical protein VFH68_08665 [Polyangia bacterium]|jgi:microcystin-dependent protein|nr:hypothetical protein [Polyangia bacterium]